MAQVHGTYANNRRDDHAHRRTSLPMWVWPLIPLVLGVLALGMSLRDTQTRDTAAAPQVTDMLTIVNQQDQSVFVGQTAQFTDVTVQSIVGERAFMVGPDATHQMLVAIDQALFDDRNDDLAQIRPGQQITLSGSVEEFPGADEAQDEWGIPEGSGEALASQQVYMHARDVQIGH